MPAITGRCVCGSVTYAGDAEPLFTMACHCKTCQRHSGTAFSTLVGVPREAITITGPIKTYTEAGGTSGDPINRRFCAACGSSIMVDKEGSPRVLIMAGTLDDTRFVRPTMNIFCESAQAWVPLSPEMKSFSRYHQ